MFIQNLNIRFHLSKLMSNDFSLRNFEIFLYDHIEEFEKEIGREFTFLLISLDFFNISSIELKNIIDSFNIDTIYFDQAIYTYVKFKLGLISLKDTFNTLDHINDLLTSKYDLIEVGYYISILGIDTTGYSSEINRLGEQTYRSDAIQELNKLVEKLDKDHILANFFEFKIMEIEVITSK